MQIRLRSRGVFNHAAKLDEAKVREMRRLRAQEKIPFTELSVRYGVSPSACRICCDYGSWIHVLD